MKQWTHRELCDKAVKWLKRSHSQSGHGCNVAVSEVASGWNGEIPDAIGFRCSGYMDGSVVVEVKVCRSDFLSDRKKPHRQQPERGMGDWRYFLCPEGVIQPEDLPNKWGLLYVTKRGGIKPIAGPATESSQYKFGELLEEFKHKKNSSREHWVLVKLFSRIGDEEKLQNELKAARTEVSRLMSRVNTLQKQLKESHVDHRRLMRELKAKGKPA